MPDRSMLEKAALIVVPIIVTILGWALMLRFLPVKNDRDILNRLLASFASSFILGCAALLYLFMEHLSIFTGLGRLAQYYDMPEILGHLWIIAVVFAISGIPGWWIVGGVARWLERRGQEVVETILDNVSRGKK